MVILMKVVYGSNDEKNRKELWGEMKEISMLVGSMRWIVLDDFDEGQAAHERMTGMYIQMWDQANLGR